MGYTPKILASLSRVALYTGRHGGRLPTSVSTTTSEHSRPPPSACGDGGQLWHPKRPPHSTFPFLSSLFLPSSSSNFRLGAWLAGDVLGLHIRDPLGRIRRFPPRIPWAVHLGGRRTRWRSGSDRRPDPGGLALHLASALLPSRVGGRVRRSRPPCRCHLLGTGRLLLPVGHRLGPVVPCAMPRRSRVGGAASGYSTTRQGDLAARNRALAIPRLGLPAYLHCVSIPGCSSGGLEAPTSGGQGFVAIGHGRATISWRCNLGGPPPFGGQRLRGPVAGAKRPPNDCGQTSSWVKTLPDFLL